MVRATFLLVALALCARVQGDSPVQKVIELLEENKMKVQADLAAEEKEMAEYSTFCDDELTEKGYAIKTAVRSIMDLQAAVEKGNSEIQELESEVSAIGTEMAEKEKQLAAANAERATEKAAFEKTEAELMTSIDELERALLEIKKGTSFLQTTSGRAKIAHDVRPRIEAALAAISKIVDASAINVQKRKALQGLLQTEQNEDAGDDLSLAAPKAAAFESATGGILEKVEEMKEKAEDGLSDARNTETKNAHGFDMMSQSLNNAIKVANEKLAAAKSGIEKATEATGQATGELQATEKTKAADETYSQTLKAECEQTAAEWSQRQVSAKEEMAVIDKAKGILAERVRVFVQVGVAAKGTMRATHDADGDDMREAETRSRVVAQLKALSRKYRSYALMEMVSSAGADPFVKIRGLIEDMIAKLLAEANEEATQKAFCDEEMSKSTAAKEDKGMTLDKLTARLDKAKTTKAELELSVKDLESQVAELDAADAEATKLRGEEHATYLKASKDFKDAAEAVTAAITVLREYYEGALIQTGASSRRAPTFGSAKGEASHAIISILEMSGENFEKLYMEVEQEEADAATAYKKLMDENRVSKAAKQAEVKGAISETKSLDVAIKNGEEDSGTVSKELDAVLTYMEKLKPQCETKVMSYAEKKSRREAEIAGLKEALSILEGETAAL